MTSEEYACGVLYSIIMGKSGVEPVYELVAIDGKFHCPSYKMQVTCKLSPDAEPVMAMGLYADTKDGAEGQAALAFMRMYFTRADYPEWKQFRRRTIDPICEMLNRYCDLHRKDPPKYTLETELADRLAFPAIIYIITVTISRCTGKGRGKGVREAMMAAVNDLIKQLTDPNQKPLQRTKSHEELMAELD